MSRKTQRVHYELDDRGIRNLPPAELAAILRGADDLIMRGGRSLLAKVLKGSRDRKVLERQLDQCPVYGYYRDLPEEQILARIDWTILHRYLRIEYDNRLPLLAFTPEGWEIERRTCANELLKGFDALLASNTPTFDMTYLKDRNRGMIELLLEMVQATGDRKYIPLLEAWAQVDYHKVQAMIWRVIQQLEGQEGRRTEIVIPDFRSKS